MSSDMWIWRGFRMWPLPAKTDAKWFKNSNYLHPKGQSLFGVAIVGIDCAVSASCTFAEML